MKIHPQPIAVIAAIILMLSILPVAGVELVSNGTNNPENVSPTSQYSLFINPITDVETGQPLEITGITDAPEGSPILITGESRYARMHPHQKMWNFSCDTFVFEGNIRKLTGGKRGFSAILNTSTLRPDDYYVNFFINAQSHNETMIRMLPSPSQLRTALILSPPELTYLIGESIPVSGLVTIPEIRAVYGEMILDRGLKESVQDNLVDYRFKGIQLKETMITDHRTFEDSIGTGGLQPGHYTLKVAAFDEQNGSWFTVNTTRIILTGSPVPGTQQKSGNPFAVSILLALTAMGIAVWQSRR